MGKIGTRTKEEVMTAILLLDQEKYPDGINPWTLRKEMLPDLHPSTVSVTLIELAKEGYLTRTSGISKDNNRHIKLYKTTKKEFHFSPAAPIKPKPISPRMLRNEIPAPSPPPTSDYGSPEYWMEELEHVIQALNTLKENIPGLLSGLLDLSKNLERLSKIKEILGQTSELTRRNI